MGDVMTSFEASIAQVFIRACLDLREASLRGESFEKFELVAASLQAAYPKEVQAAKDYHRNPK